MSVSSISSVTTAPQNSYVNNPNSALDMDDFMLLLSVQMQNQDISNPMSNSEMMQQLTSMATVESMNTFTEYSMTQYALGMVGQTVTVAEADEVTGELTTKTGKVVGIDLFDMQIYIEGDTKGYGLGNVMEVGTIPEAEVEEESEDDLTVDGTTDENATVEDSTEDDTTIDDDTEEETEVDQTEESQEP